MYSASPPKKSTKARGHPCRPFLAEKVWYWQLFPKWWLHYRITNFSSSSNCPHRYKGTFLLTTVHISWTFPSGESCEVLLERWEYFWKLPWHCPGNLAKYSLSWRLHLLFALLGYFYSSCFVKPKAKKGNQRENIIFVYIDSLILMKVWDFFPFLLQISFFPSSWICYAFIQPLWSWDHHRRVLCRTQTWWTYGGKKFVPKKCNFVLKVKVYLPSRFVNVNSSVGICMQLFPVVLVRVSWTTISHAISGP